MAGFRDLTLYVVRHGECEHNVAGWAAGHDDSPLTATGRSQARAKGRTLREIAPEADALDYFSSSLHRACTTMELMREEMGLSPTAYRADRRLMEGDLGDHARISTQAFLSHAEFVADPWNYVRPNGESVAMVHARAGRFLATLTRDAVIVTHALTAEMIRAHALGLSPDQAMGYHMPNAGLLRLSMGTEARFGG